MKKDQNILIKAMIIGSLAGITTALISKFLGMDTVVGGSIVASAIASAAVVKKHYEKPLVQEHS